MLNFSGVQLSCGLPTRIMELGPKAPCMIIVSGIIADLHDTGSSGDLEGPSGLVGPL